MEIPGGWGSKANCPSCPFWTTHSTKTSSNQLIVFCVLKYETHAIIIIFHLWGFLSATDAGSRGNKIAGIDFMLTCSVTLTFSTTLQTMLSTTDTFRTGNTYVCLIESQLKGVKKAGNNSRCLVIIIYYFLNSEVLLNKSVCNYELRGFFSRIIHVM